MDPEIKTTLLNSSRLASEVGNFFFFKFNSREKEETYAVKAMKVEKLVHWPLMSDLTQIYRDYFSPAALLLQCGFSNPVET